MSDHERGAYTPQPDAPLSFDPRTSREGRPLPLALIASCIVLATLVVALFMFYQSGMRHGSDAPTPVGTPVDQFRAPPPANGQAPEGLTVVAAAPPAEAPPAPAPGVPEKPVERGSTAPVQAAPTPMPTVAAPPPPPPAPTQRAVVEAPPPPPATKPVVTAKAAPKPEPVAHPAPTKAAPVKAAAASRADPVGALLEPAKTAKPAKVATAKPAKPVAEPAAAAAVAKGAAVVQIGAYLSEAQATDAWHRVSGLMGGESTGRGRHIEPVEANGSTRYLSQFTGVASRADAVKFCTTLKAKSQDCIVKSAN